MPIVGIKEELCDGCGICLDSCHTDVIRMNDAGKAVVSYPSDCDTCFLCEQDCPRRAITVSAEILGLRLPY